MPNILVKVPKGIFPVEARERLCQLISEAAATSEQIPADLTMRATTWVVLDEVEPGMLTCAGVDMTSQLLPCIAVVYVPQGVIDEQTRTLYARNMHEAFLRALPTDEKRRLITSVMLHDVVDGTWGVNGEIWTLPVLARAAGYVHLQHLVS